MFPYAHLDTPFSDTLGFPETPSAYLEDMDSIDSIDPFSLHYKLDPVDASPLTLFGPYESSSSSNSTRSTTTPDIDYCSDQESHPDAPFWRKREDTPYPNRSGTPLLPKREDTPAEDESSNDIALSFPTADRKRSWKSFYASLNLSPESLEAHLDSAASSPVLTPLRHLSVTRAASPSAHDSDQDAYGESDGDGDDDDEYLPFVETNPRKRSRSSISVRHNASPSPSSHHNRRSVKRARVSPPSRNKQASSTTSVAIREAVSVASCHQMNFICPECGWKQTNRRMPDFKRHMKTHTRPTEDDQSKGWWCKGVLLENVDQYKKIPRDALPYMFLGQERIGGCMRTFSRRDALKRHLDNGNVQCVGTPCAAGQEE